MFFLFIEWKRIKPQTNSIYFSHLHINRRTTLLKFSPTANKLQTTGTRYTNLSYLHTFFKAALVFILTIANLNVEIKSSSIQYSFREPSELLFIVVDLQCNLSQIFWNHLWKWLLKFKMLEGMQYELSRFFSKHDFVRRRSLTYSIRASIWKFHCD